MLLSGPAQADRDQAKADFAACSSLNLSSRKLREAGTEMEVWVRGGNQKQTVAKLQSILTDVTLELNRFTKQAWPPHSDALHRGAISCAQLRLKALQEAQALVNQVNLSPTALKNYCKVTLESTRLSQKEWFRVRLAFLKSNLTHEKSVALADFYQWQTPMLAKWLEEANISAEAQGLLTSNYNTNAQRQALADSSYQLMKKAQQLQADTEKIPATPRMAECQKLAISEQIALAKLCEAIKYLYDDPSQDADSLLRHSLRTLADCSIALEEATSVALRQALDSR
jgi:hypothetical protein